MKETEQKARKDAGMPSETVRVRVGLVSQAAVTLPLWIAEEEGYLAAEGLVAEYVVLGVTDRVTQALRDRTVDVALTTAEGTIADAVSGGGLRVLAGITNHPPLSLVAHVPSIEALRGGRIGTSSLTEGTRHLAEHMLAAHGLRPPDDYDFALTGNHSERWRLLLAGELTAALQPTPYSHMATAAGLHNLGPVRTHIPDFAFLAVCADGAHAEANRDTMVGFLRALNRGAGAFHRAPARWTALAAGMMRVPEEFAGLSTAEMARDHLIAPDLRLSPAALRGTVAVLRAAGILPPAGAGRHEAERALDHTYLDRALA
jgi:NitT/TauT family transport system substrate-binding protein